jgi:hypothetical protein
VPRGGKRCDSRPLRSGSSAEARIPLPCRQAPAYCRHVVAVTAIIVTCLAGGVIARHTIPKTYAAFNAIAWTIEGVFLAVALAGLLYQCVGGNV